MFNDCEEQTIRLSEDTDGFFNICNERLEYIGIVPLGSKVELTLEDGDYYD